MTLQPIAIDLIRPSCLNPPGRLDPAGATRPEDVIPTRIKDSYFRNKVDVVVAPTDLDAYRDLPPTVTIIQDCVTAGEQSVVRVYRDGRFSNVAQVNRVYVLSHNDSPAANYQVYVPEQAADWVILVRLPPFSRFGVPNKR